MANNTVLDVGSGGDTITTFDLSGATYPSTGKLPATCVYVSANTSTAPTPVTDANGFPVRPATSTTWAATQSGSWTVAATQSGSWTVAATQSGSWTVAATQSGTWNITNVSGTISLPTGASTAAKQPALGTAGAASTDVITVQGIASMTALKVDNNGTFVVQVDGTALTRLTDIETNTDSGAVVGNGAAATAQRVTLANDSTGIVALTTSTASIGKLAANSGVDIGDVDVLTLPAITIAAAQTLATVTTVGTVTAVTTVSTVSTVTAVSDASVQGKAAIDAAISGNPVLGGNRASAAVPSAVSTDGDVQASWTDLVGRRVVKQQAATSTVTTVADTASSTQLLAANTARLGATIENDSSAVLYVKLGTTASATDYTVRMVQYAYYEVPYGFTGRIDGIWASDPGDGAARISELT